MTRIYEHGGWWWIANAPCGAWYGYPFPSRTDAAEALGWVT